MSLRALFEEEGDSKYLCLAPVAKWSNGIDVFEMPIIQGKLGEMNLYLVVGISLICWTDLEQKTK